MLPTQRSMASRKIAFSMAITTSTATCHSTFSVAITSCAHGPERISAAKAVKLQVTVLSGTGKIRALSRSSSCKYEWQDRPQKKGRTRMSDPHKSCRTESYEATLFLLLPSLPALRLQLAPAAELRLLPSPCASLRPSWRGLQHASDVFRQSASRCRGAR